MPGPSRSRLSGGVTDAIRPENGLAQSSLHRARLRSDVGGRAHHGLMANIEIMEIRAFEPRCLDCGETGPIESSAFWAMAWEEAHVCVAVRIDAEAPELMSA